MFDVFSATGSGGELRTARRKSLEVFALDDALGDDTELEPDDGVEPVALGAVLAADSDITDVFLL